MFLLCSCCSYMHTAYHISVLWKVKMKMKVALAEFMRVFVEVSAQFFEHNHVAKAQQEDFDRLIDELPANHAIMLEDFR